MQTKQPPIRHHGPMSRREFFRRTGLLGAGAAALGVASVGTGLVRLDRRHVRVTRTRLAMGSFLTMTAVHRSGDEAEEAIALAFDEVARLERILSRFDASTPVSELNRAAHLRDVPPELDEVVASSLRMHRETRGCFDPTVQPLIDFYRGWPGAEEERVPDEAELAPVLRRVGCDKLRATAGEIAFLAPDMSVSFDGIAVGWIVDRASDLLARRGIANHMINAGGDIVTRGSRGEGEPWTIAIEDPWKRREFPGLVRLAGGAVSTSGSYEAYFDREHLFHHIVDPRSARCPAAAVSVSVTARTSMEADALSTSLLVMGPDEGIAFLEGRPGCEALYVTRDRRIVRSRGWETAV